MSAHYFARRVITMKQASSAIAVLLALGIFTSNVPVFAATPDAGQLLREQQPQRQLPQQLPKPEAEKELVPASDSGIRVELKAIKFSGNEGIASENDLQALLAGSIGKSLTFTELQGLATRVTAYLKEKGWFLARAYLPKQDITTGTVEIAIIQGKSDGTLTIKRDKTTRISEEKIRSIAQNAVRSGEPINEQKLENAVLLMNELPGITAKASLAPGTTPGSTGIQVDVSEGPLFSGGVWGDNYGNRYTGTWRGNGMLNVNDPLHYGDQLSLLLTGAEGLMQGRVGYTMPLAANGLKGNLAYTGMSYKLIGDLASLKSEGQSHTVDAGLSYPLLRSRTTNVTTSLGYQFKSLTDSNFDTDVRDKRLNSGTLGLNGDRYDTLLGGGYTTWNVGVTSGDLHEKIADIAITKSEGGYTRFNLGLSRLQRLAEALSLNLSYSGQFSLDNLDSSEKFNLGGPSGVRAYPIGEGSGDAGSLFNIDLRYDLPLPAKAGSVQIVGFYDAGYIKLHQDPWLNSIATATDKNEYWLNGAGLGLNYSYSGTFSLKTSWAHTIGDNPGRSTGGKDSDGRSEQNRFWLQAMVYF